MDALVRVFRQVRRVLHPQGTLWVVIDDTHCTRRAIRQDGKRSVARDTASGENTLGRWSDAAAEGRVLYSSRFAAHGLKDKDLMLLPARLALALQADGWWVRSAICWVKPNFAPRRRTTARSTGTRRCCCSAAASATGSTRPRCASARRTGGSGRGRDVWAVRPSAEKGDHTSAFPVELAAKCVLAGAPPGSWVLDPFAGTGTTGVAAVQHGSNATLVELDPGHARTIRKRLGDRLDAARDRSGARTATGPRRRGSGVLRDIGS